MEQFGYYRDHLILFFISWAILEQTNQIFLHPLIVFSRCCHTDRLFSQRAKISLAPNSWFHLLRPKGLSHFRRLQQKKLKIFASAQFRKIPARDKTGQEVIKLSVKTFNRFELQILMARCLTALSFRGEKQQGWSFEVKFQWQKASLNLNVACLQRFKFWSCFQWTCRQWFDPSLLASSETQFSNFGQKMRDRHR